MGKKTSRNRRSFRLRSRRAIRPAAAAAGAVVPSIDRLESRQLLAADLGVNFQPAGAEPVTGYIVDAGDTFGARNGQSYGWTVSHTDAVVDRDAIADQLLDTNVGVKQSARWELALPNGQYQVKVGVGDSAAASKNNVWVEGLNLFNYQSQAAGTFDDKSMTVNVSDGRLTVGIGSNATGQTRLTYIEVTASGTTSPPTSPPASPPPASPPPPVSEPTSPPASVPGVSRVNFQPAGSATVAGYLVDAGVTYGVRTGGTFGWTVNHTDAVVDRGINGNQLLDTNVGVKQGARWEFAVANGQYTVTVGVGDAAIASKNNVWIEGVNLFNYQSMPASGFASKSVTVNVSDGRLTMGIGGAATGQTRIDFIEIASGTTSPPTSPPPTSPPPTSPPPTSPPPPAPPPPVAGEMRVNFQPSTAPTVSGYTVDSGLGFGSRSGLSFGWTTGHTDAVVDRNINSNQLIDTAVGVKAGARWELAVPNGKYAVKVGVGDAAAGSKNNVWVEGVNLFNYQSLGANSFASKSVTVTVSDGRLTIGVGGAATGQTKLDYVEVIPQNQAAINLGTILPLGDSITWGYEDKKTPTGGYRSRLYTKLSDGNAGFTYAGSEVDTYASPLQAANLVKHEGHGAFRTDQIAGNLLGVAPGTNVSSNNGGHWLDGTASRPAIYPQIVLLHIGTNDMIQGVAPATAAANLDQIVKILTDNRPGATVYVSTIIPMQDPGKAAALQTYNSLVRDVVTKYRNAGKNVVLVDMYAQFVDSGGNIRTGLYSDPVHPNRAGYDKIGDTWAAAILP